MTRLSLICLTLGASLVAASCGGSEDSAPGDVESFCAALEALEDIDTSGEDLGPFVDGLRDVDDAAPAEIADDIAQLLSFIERTAEISSLTGDEQIAALEEFDGLEADFDLAAGNFEDYVRTNCPDLEESVLGS